MAVLQARAITKRFGGLTAVKDVDFTLDGGIAAIIGPNGAGKTTFFNVLTGLYVPDGGEVRLGETSLLGLRPDQITALGVCRTFQNIRLFKAMTAVENVLVGMHAHVRLGVWDVLTRGGRFKAAEGEAWRNARALLERVGLGRQMHVEARHLAYGDQRRLELARALAASPRVLLLDEPTAGMTGAEARTLMGLLRGLVADFHLAIVLIEHNMRVVMEVSDRVTVLDHGEKIAEGTPREVQTDARVIEAYLGRRGAAPAAS